MTNITWTGHAGDDLFNDGANWSSGTVPGSGDTAVISPSAAVDIYLNAAVTVGALTMAKDVTLTVGDSTSALSFTIGTSAGASTFSNAGVFALDSLGPSADLVVGATSLTLSGTGTILLGGLSNNTVTGATGASVLNNTGNLIEGAGQLGAGTLTFINGAAGVVDADSQAGLVLNTGTVTISNSGLLEATGSGGLTLDSNVNNGASGKITAAGGDVYAQGGTISGGTLSASAGCTIVTTNSTLNGTAHELTIDGNVAVADNSSLSVLGTIANTGTIAMLASHGYGVTLYVGPTAAAGTTTLTGAGALALSDDASNSVVAGFAGDTLVNLNNTISGAGQIGNGGSLTIVNDATIDANGVDTLVINTADTVTNNKLIEATGRGGLLLEATVQDAKGTISAAGGVVTLQNADIVGGLLEASGGGYILDNSNLTLDGTKGLTNKTTILAEANTNLSLLGTLTNDGTLAVAASHGYGVNLYVGPSAGAGTMTLTGSGHVTLSDDADNEILAAGKGDTLVNLNNTISGAGQIGNGGSLTLINDATINANGIDTLIINSADLITNTKLIEATGSGGLNLTGTFENGTTGTLAAAGGVISLLGADIEGGVLTQSGLGYFADGSSATLDGSVNAITNDATILAVANTNLTLLGTLTNAGTISLAASHGYGTDLYVGPGGTAGTMTLTGSGVLTLSDDQNNQILANFAGDTLVNLNNTIAGAGNIGNGGSLTVINDATINANGNDSLVIDSALAVTNNALIEATGSGGLVLNGTIVNGASGTISAVGATVTLSGATIEGGLLNSASGLFVENSSATLDGSVNTITSNGTLVVEDNTSLNLLGTLANSGTLLLEAGHGYGTTLTVGPTTTPGTMTLTGSGALTLTDDPNNHIVAGVAGDTLVNLNNIIAGAGVIGSGNTLNVVNDATIDANGIRTLVINAGTLTNTSLIESTGSGGVLLDGIIVNASATLSAVTGSVGIEGILENAGGTISLAAGDLILGQSAAGTIQGGTLKASGTGSVVVTGSGGTLDGTTNTVTSNAKIIVQANTNLSLLGTISNAGSILLASSHGYGVTLYVGPTAAAGTTTLTGAGSLALSDDASNSVVAGFAGDTLVNLNNTISGAGQIGNGGSLTIVNDATIDANGVDTLIINTADTVTNNKLIEATGRGGLLLEATVQDAKGTISAAGGVVTLQNADIVGGLLEASGGGYILDNSNLTLDGTKGLTNKTTILAEANTNLSLLGTLTNDGTLAVAASHGYGVNLYVGPSAGAGTMTLTGSGHVTLSDDADNEILAAGKGDTLVNLNNTISGAGQIGNGGSLTLINDATINANGIDTLIINSADLITNTKLIEATGSGGLNLTGTFENGASGTLAAAGGVISLLGADIEGGVLTQSSLGYFADGSSATLDGSVNAITNDATILAVANTNLTLLGTLTNAGTISLAASHGYGTDLYVGPGGTAGTMTLTGSGVLTLSDDQNNQILANFAGDTLVNLNNIISGAGNIGNGGSLTLINGGTINANGTNGLVINSALLTTNNGLMEATGGGGLTIDSAVANSATGTISVTSGLGGGALSFLGPITNAGTIDAASGSAFITQTVTGTGTLAIGATGTLSLLDGAGTGQTADFLASTGALDLTNPLQFLGTIAGFGGSDVIDLVSTPETTWGFANGTLTVKDGNATVASLQFSGSYTQGSFIVGADGHGGTSVTFS